MTVLGGRRLPHVALDLLSDVERAESELLSWGVVDSSFTREELEVLAQERLIAALEADPSRVPFNSAGELVDTLRDHHLLFELPDPEQGSFRSRTAEAIRLFAHLKQLFSHHLRDGTWRTAANLVADYRLILRPRQYPRRRLSPDEVAGRLAAAWPGDTSVRGIVRAVLAADSETPLMLADFQLDAAERILRELATGPRRAGTMVCAGTGSGKTLAFYIPALLLLARFSSSERWTRCLALYPRNELLKDQLSGALRQIRLLNSMLEAEGRFPVTVGALFGDVPQGTEDGDALRRRNWTRVGSGPAAGWACPYVGCPQPGCEHSNLVWLDTDREQGIERLCCDRGGCGFVEKDAFVLTRRSMIERPPDLLFTGIEMVNQTMSAVPTRRLLGVGVDRPERRPQLVLLDEAHTYSGTYGAQAALLLRRWKRASLAAPHFVGLSATLEDAGRFFADLIGEPESRVEEIAPRAVDLIQEGQEVLLALRGDPASKTSLLSTSIQAAMLLRRVLDPPNTPASLFGSKVFVFTDDLDVTNRLFHSLLDAEGWEIGHRGIRPRREPPLAGLRSRDVPEHDARFSLGQSWDLVEDLGHELSDRPVVRVGRTSSQDTGVDRAAEAIVATASLEVGFDDPDVGAVLQHKAPRDAASFLQRQGRAGRPRGTRPWTVVILSDYGRDRIAYQGYDQLFSPQLKPRNLPVRNRYVLRIQAVLALVDWLATQLVARFADTQARLWIALAQPPGQDRYQQSNEKRLRRVGELVDRLLEGGALTRELARYLEQALAVGPDVVERLLWAPPRSLMLSVLPTISRRLRRNWAVAVGPGTPARQESHSPRSPLPEFVPRALFTDLNLPEVAVSLPPHQEGDIEQMPILQSLREFAPGRVTRRFGVARRDVSHWLPIPDDGGPTCFVETFLAEHDADVLGDFRVEHASGTSEILCLRPRRLQVAVPPQAIGSTSNARPIWASQLLPRVPPTPGELPFGSPWLAIIRSVGFFSHGYGNPIEIRRFALGSRYDIRRHGQAISGSVVFARQTSADPRPAALGCALEVDAMRLETALPSDLHLQAQTLPALVRALRVARFAYELQTDPQLDGITSTFDRGWLVQICLSALVLEASRTGTALERAVESVFEERAFVSLEPVLDTLFQAIVDDAGEGPRDDRTAELRQLLRNALVQDAFRRSAPALWSDPKPTWEPWLQARFLSTLGAAVLDACQQACPDVDAGDLCLDIHPGPRGTEEGCSPREHNEIWLSETSPGGSGVIEALTTAYASDPRRFFHLVEAALAPSDFEEIDTELGTLVAWLDVNSPDGRDDLISVVQSARSARTHRATVDANDELRRRLEFAGIAATHPVMVAVHARVLRPGSSPDTDGLLAAMLVRWRELEDQLGVEVDARVVAYAMSSDDALDRALAGLGAAPAAANLRSWRHGTLCGLLWPRGAEVRSQMLSAYNPFADLPPTDRWLVLAALPATTSEVRIEDADWYPRLCVALINEGAAVLAAPPEWRRELRSAIQQTLLRPLDTDTLLVQPALTGVTQEGRRLRARFEVREGLQ